MSTQTIALNFIDLTDFSAGSLNETIPPCRAVKATIDAYKAGKVVDCEIYKSWAISLFPRYGPTAITDADLNQLLNLFSAAIEELLNECTECVSEAQNDKLITFLKCSVELFTWIRSLAKKFGTNEITEFLCFGLLVINNYLVVLSKQINQVFINKLVEKSLALQRLLLGIVSENLGKFYFNNDSQPLFNNLISHLCAIGELTPKLDIKTTVDTWKSISRLASQNANQIQSENSSPEDVAWLKRPMSFLINEISRNVQTVFKENSISEPIQQIEKFLKVTNFYLRVLQKITTDYRHVPFPICEDLLNTLALVLTPPAYIVNTPVHKAIMEYIMKDFKELIPFAYRNDLFFKLLLSDHFEESFYEILLEIIKLSIRRKETECLDPQVLCAALQKSSKCAHLLLSTSTYNQFIETLSAFQIHSHQDQVAKALVNSVLQDDIVLALIAIDIWCTIFRSSTHPTRLAYFKFWRDINEHFAKFSNRLPALYVEILLKNLYAFLNNQEKAEIWNKFNACALSHDRFLLTIGLDSIPNSPVRQSIIQHFVKELIRLLKECSNEMAVDNFYTIVKDLKLLTPVAFRNDKAIEMLLQYLEIAMKSKKFTLLVQSILDFIAPKLESIDDSRILKILTGLSMELSTFKDHSAKMSLIRFLRRVSKNPRLEKHSEEILKIVESDELTRHFGNIERTTGEKIDQEKSGILLQEILKNRSMEKVKRTHVCPVQEEMHVKKRMKTDAMALLESLENNVDKLQSIAQLGQLSSSNIEIIKRVMSKLEGIGALS